MRTIVALILAVAVLAPALKGRALAQSEQVVARAKPAVVLVEVVLSTGSKALGSGVVFDASGYILTNHHVVEGASEVSVTLSNGRSYPATVVDFERVERAGVPRVDAAVLKIAASGLATLPLRSNTPVRDGQEVLVLGYPGGIETDRMSITRGIVSAVRDGWIETDALIVPGNSGGPMIDAAGNVIGLATFITGYDHRFGGATWLEDAVELAARAVAPAGARSRAISVPGIEYFMPRDLTSSGYAGLLRKN